MTYDAAECIRRGLREWLKQDADCDADARLMAFGALSCLVVELYDRGESARCRAVERLRELEADGRALLDAERQS